MTITITVLSRSRVRMGQVATIPMPEPAYMEEVVVRVGRAEYIVYVFTSGDTTVYPRYATRRRPMRSCATRSAILATVEWRALA